ncbi:uncharacterized protein B0J16DRAFT_118089 [Fusarium flagelliforme]|uniref:uncharacterized protein n=1 Tax=Fusarium flagelliforme TaxID=2675880 RepID=UPI001E8E4C2D|nr:uncharacterized protein B0J16DRAFT_118089 [Fusarium flagelliforme]KAH7189623.1 hypothetical protein B0J16DRAFT_118089 [Fusarium flagelliforme]
MRTQLIEVCENKISLLIVVENFGGVTREGSCLARHLPFHFKKCRHARPSQTSTTSLPLCQISNFLLLHNLSCGAFVLTFSLLALLRLVYDVYELLFTSSFFVAPLCQALQHFALRILNI